ncbi:DUF4384 domain-containing protein [Sandarakinorhabdus sp.]|uniref:DUF4384 domain-containing protein n=1 Tax=Sandarakinorhabdus sp. TaxID=1916663 RepID=UPI003F6EB3D6
MLNSRYFRRLVGLCTALAMPVAAQDINVAARPAAPVEQASTNFAPALACMDQLLARTQYQKRVRILVHRLDEPAQEIGANTRDLIVRALARMSLNSRFFQIETDPSEDTLAALPPDALVVEGSVTAFERDLKGRNKSGGVTLGPLGFGFGSNNTESRMELTLYLKTGGKQPAILPGTTSQVAIALASRSRNGDVAGNISFFGGFIGAGFSRNDGPMAALSAMVDLALIQSIGSFAQVPFERCLAGTASNQTAVATLRRNFDRMKPAQRVAAIAQALADRGLYKGAIGTDVTPELRQAIASFQRQQGLIATGEILFELFEALQTQAPRLPQAAQLPGSLTGNPLGLLISPASPALRALDIYESAQVGAEAIVGMNERISVSLAVVRPGHIMCYYVDGAKQMALIYPNRQRRDGSIQPGQNVALPGPGDTFEVKALHPDLVEQMICYGATVPILPLLPEPLRQMFGVGTAPLDAAEIDSIDRILLAANPPGLSKSSLSWRILCRSGNDVSGYATCAAAAATPGP